MIAIAAIDEQAEFGVEIPHAEPCLISARRDALSREWSHLRALWGAIARKHRNSLHEDLLDEVDEMLDPESGYGADSILGHVANCAWRAGDRIDTTAMADASAWCERLQKYRDEEHQFAREEAAAYRRCLNKNTKGKEAWTR